MGKVKTEMQCPNCDSWLIDKKALKFHQLHPDWCIKGRGIDGMRQLRVSRANEKWR